MNYNADIQRVKRHFLPNDFGISTWDALLPFYEELANRTIENKSELEQWLCDVSELQAAISEDACWRQIHMTCDTENKSLEEAFTFFCTEIEPYIKPYADALNRKLMQSPFMKELDQTQYSMMLRSIENEINLYREENIQLSAEVNVLAQQYGAITGKMTIEHQGSEYTLQQAAKFLMQSDRSLREEIYHKVNKRRQEDKESLHNLFDTLVQKRHQIALNAGFENFRDYMFQALGRFDYGVSECEQFHEAIKEYITPIVEHLYEEKKKQLGLHELKPYDTDAEPEGQLPLEPFKTGTELLEKSKLVFQQLNPFFGECLNTMERLGHFDLESRKGKAPGGYNCPLAESGAPFIFMNAAGTADDVVTMMHEGGHAIHSFLAHPLKLSAFKEYPMEVAELASMSMELFSIEHWHLIYKKPQELKRAKLELLERALSIFPWIATIDAFQHWIYTHPSHNHNERDEAWIRIYEEYAPKNISWDGLELYKEVLWQKQLHLFEVPFYYIEYGIAQLGALAMWQQYMAQPQQALQKYCQALSLGGTRSLPELYETAGIAFDFSKEKVKNLSEFVMAALKEIQED